VPAHTPIKAAVFRRETDRRGISKGKKRRYHKKYCGLVRLLQRRVFHALTCEVQTLLNNTNTKVCTNHVKGRSCSLLANRNPARRDNPIWGTKLINGDRMIASKVLGGGSSFEPSLEGEVR